METENDQPGKGVEPEEKWERGGKEKTSCRRKGRKIVSERQRLVIERHTSQKPFMLRC